MSAATPVLTRGTPSITRYMAGADGRRNVRLDWPSGASVMVDAGHNEDPDAVVRELSGARCRVLGDDGVIRFDGRGAAWLMNRQRDGWGERGYRHDSLAALLSYWAVEVTGAHQDEHGIYLSTRSVP